MLAFFAIKLRVTQATLSNLESAENALLQRSLPNHVKLEKNWTGVAFNSQIFTLFSPGLEMSLGVSRRLLYYMVILPDLRRLLLRWGY